MIRARPMVRTFARVDPAFTDNANCGGADVNQFFPREREQGIPERARKAARQYCAGCPVTEACNQAALDGDEIGLWGGAWHWRDENRQHQTVTLLPATVVAA